MSHDPSSTPVDPPPAVDSPANPILKYVINIGLITLIIGLLAAYLFPVTRGREASRRSNCKNNLKQIGLALMNYHEAYGTFPPAYTVDAVGRPLHSWRTLLLPFIDQRDLYEKINLSKPWDDPVNAVPLETIVSVYSCPSARISKNHTTYMGSTGPEAAFYGNTGRSRSDITHPIQQTLLVIEVCPTQAIPWMSPLDLPAITAVADHNDADRAHRGIDHVLFADGSVFAMNKQDTAAQRRSWITITGGD